jgi:hypothetical protein
VTVAVLYSERSQPIPATSATPMDAKRPSAWTKREIAAAATCLARLQSLQCSPCYTELSNT